MLALDVHVHLYDPDRIAGLVGRAAEQARRAVQAQRGVAPVWGQEGHELILGVQRGWGTRRLEELLRTRQAEESLTVSEGEDGMWAVETGSDRVWLAPGRQVVTADRLEVLGLFAEGLDVADGAMEMAACVEAVRAWGGIPVIPWSPGKWWFGRGRRVRAFVNGVSPDRVFLADTSIRPKGTLSPPALARGRTRGIGILAGSDPLPIPGDEQEVGRYLSLWDGVHSPGEGVSAWLRRGLGSGSPENWRMCGARNSAGVAVRRWMANARRGKKG